jgi:hypothetical protein
VRALAEKEGAKVVLVSAQVSEVAANARAFVVCVCVCVCVCARDFRTEPL